MRTSTDYFDLAVKNTFIKTSQIPCISSSSFGSLHPENQNNDEGLNSPLGSESIINDLKNGTVELQSPIEPSKRNPEVSYAAQALEEIENLRRMNLNVRFSLLLCFFLSEGENQFRDFFLF